jgi:hypothetical protein
MHAMSESHRRRAQLLQAPHFSPLQTELRGAHKVVKILRVSARMGARSARINRYFTRGACSIGVMRPPNPPIHWRWRAARLKGVLLWYRAAVLAGRKGRENQERRRADGHRSSTGLPFFANGMSKRGRRREAVRHCFVLYLVEPKGQGECCRCPWMVGCAAVGDFPLRP